MTHGKVSSYTHGKCKCAECRGAFAAYMRAYRGHHATRSKYVYGCRCFRCTRANREYQAQRRLRLRQAKPVKAWPPKWIQEAWS